MSHNDNKDIKLNCELITRNKVAILRYKFAFMGN